MAKSAKKSTVKSDQGTKSVNINKPATPKSNFSTDVISSTDELFLSELKDTYWAENHLVKSLPKMAAAAASADLKQALTEHLEVTKQHVARLEQIFEMLDEHILAKKCDAMEGLVMSGEHIIENTVTDTAVRDTGIISSGLKVENFEITTYQGLIQLANTLGKPEIGDILQQNMSEEEEARDILMTLSEKGADDFNNK